MSEDVRALIEEARTAESGYELACEVGWAVTWEQQATLINLVHRLADALDSAAVSSPPTITDEAKCSPLNPLCIGSERGGACSCNDGDDWPQALPTPPTITDDMAERAEIERDSHKYTLVIGSNPPRALCTCGWEGLYAGEWRMHREKAALTAALHPGGQTNG